MIRPEIYKAARTLALLSAGVVSACTGTPQTRPAPGSTADSPRSLPLPEAIAATAVGLHPWRASGSDSAGFAALTRAIGDARIVLLGEPWHGDAGAIRLRTALVRHLHERLGFDVLVFEADFYSLNTGWREVRPGEAQRFAAANVYPFWSTSRAALPLWEYIEEQARQGDTLHVAGVDIRHVGHLARTRLPAHLGERLAEVRSVTPREHADFLSVLGRFLADEWGFQPNEGEQRQFLGVLDRLEQHLTEQKLGGSLLGQEVRSLRSGARFAWGGGGRDRGMGENFNWLATRLYPKQKIMVWAHNNHIITDKWMYFSAEDSLIRRGVARRSQESIGRSTYLGDEIKEFFGDQVYALATLSYSGTYSPDVRTSLAGEPGNFDSLAVLAPAPEGTLEAALAKTGHPIAFVDLHPFRGAEEPARARALDYTVTPPRAMRYWRGYDGFLFLRETFGLNEAPPPTWARNPGS